MNGYKTWISDVADDCDNLLFLAGPKPATLRELG